MLKALAIVLVLSICGYAYYYEFVDTLMLSELIPTQNPIASIVVGLFDFNTGLTRYDVHRLGQKSNYWNRRIAEVEAISDPAQRQQACDSLVIEMMNDPAMRKITQKVFRLAGEASFSIIKSLLSGS